MEYAHGIIFGFLWDTYWDFNFAAEVFAARDVARTRLNCLLLTAHRELDKTGPLPRENQLNYLTGEKLAVTCLEDWESLKREADNSYCSTEPD